MPTIDEFRRLGQQSIEDGGHDSDMVRLQWWTDVPLKHTIEYQVADFAAEVGFYRSVFGFPFLSLTEDYALCHGTDWTFSFSFRPAADSRPPDLSFLKLQFYVANLDEVAAALTARQQDHEITEDSPGQRVIHFSTPGGLPVEIWSGDER